MRRKKSIKVSFRSLCPFSLRDHAETIHDTVGEFLRPAGLENGDYPPFELLVSLFERLEKAKVHYKPRAHERRNADVATLVNVGQFRMISGMQLNYDFVDSDGGKILDQISIRSFDCYYR